MSGSNAMRVYYEIRQKSYTLQIKGVDMDFYRHMHEEIEILYMRSGTQHIIIDNKEYVLKQGEAAVIFPNTVHSYFREAMPKPVDSVMIICSAKFYGEFLPDLTDYTAPNPIITKENISDDARYAFSAIDRTTDENVREAWTVIIMSDIIRNLKIRQKKCFPVEEMSGKIIKYIEQNFTRNITLNSIAEALSVSRSYVTRIFSEQIRINFRRYLGAMRAEYAASLIRTTPENLTSISGKAGFESQSTFNRTFKEIYGMTPREFRNNIQRYSKTV